MKVFVPLVFFEVADEDGGICDGILQCFHELSDLQILYPDIDYIEIDVSKPNIHDN